MAEANQDGVKVKAITNTEQLIAAGLGSTETSEGLKRVSEQFALRITPQIVGLIDLLDENDPIKKQYVPSLDELRITPSESPAQ